MTATGGKADFDLEASMSATLKANPGSATPVASTGR
jgi:hypothetical protein